MLTDFHTHTVSSDGTMTVSESVAYASDSGVRIMAVTDHDSVGSLGEFMSIAAERGVVPVPGIEFGCPYGAGEVHVLGYGFDFLSPGFASALGVLSERRRNRIRKTVEMLNSLGVPVSCERVFAMTTGSPGRLHIARAAFEAGLVASEGEMFDLYIGEGRPAYVRKDAFSCSEAVGLIREAGGVSVLAHPGATGLSLTDIDRIVSMGVDGIEVFYPEHEPLYRRSLELYAESRGLLVTGGSDFHGVRNGVLGPIGMPDYPEAHLRRFLDRLGVDAGGLLQ